MAQQQVICTNWSVSYYYLFITCIKILRTCLNGLSTLTLMGMGIVLLKTDFTFQIPLSSVASFLKLHFLIYKWLTLPQKRSLSTCCTLQESKSVWSSKYHKYQKNNYSKRSLLLNTNPLTHQTCSLTSTKNLTI